MSNGASLPNMTRSAPKNSTTHLTACSLPNIAVSAYTIFNHSDRGFFRRSTGRFDLIPEGGKPALKA